MNYKKDLLEAFNELFPDGFNGFDPGKPCPPKDREEYIACLLPGFAPIDEATLEAAAAKSREKKAARRERKLRCAEFTSSIIAAAAGGQQIDSGSLLLALGLLLARNGNSRSEIDAMESAIAGRG